MSDLGQPGPHRRTAVDRALDLESAVECLDAVDEASQAGARVSVRAAASVVGHLDEHIAGLAAHSYGGGAGGRVAGDVRERLRDDEVRRRLEGLGRPVVKVDAQLPSWST